MRVFIVVFLCLSSRVLCQDEANQPSTPPSDDACIDKPCGPFMCQARCVASCLDTSLASNVQECLTNFCQDFSENTPCPLNDTACWKTCGFINSPDDPPPPPVPEDFRVVSWANGFSSSNNDPKIIRLEWPSTKDATVYIVQAFPMFGKDPASNTQHVVENITTETSFTFERSDLCIAYMTRIMAVNGLGTSSPRYLIVDAWKPELHFDENFDVRSIRREGDYVKVQIDYTPPSSWSPGDVELENTFVRAHRCQGPLDENLFLSKQPDEDGYFTPTVLINETASSIELSFPAKIMLSKCSYSYKVSALRTLCNATVQLDKSGGPSVDFVLHCSSVENSECPQESDDYQPQNNTSSGDSADVSSPETKEMTQPENTTTTDGDVVGKGDSKEVVVVANPEAIKELEHESTTTASTPKMESGEVAVAAIPEALKELEEEKAATVSTTPSPDTTIQGGSEEVTKETPPHDKEPQPPMVAVEPHDPNMPLCRLIEFDAQAEFETELGSTNEEKPPTLTISWLEDRPVDVSSNPSHFMVRYGPVVRTLIVDPQPQIRDETIVRTQEPESSEEVSRVLRVTGLTPNTLYAFQICAVFNPNVDLAAAWDTAPHYVVDLSAANGIWRNGEINPATTAATNTDGIVPPNDLDFIDSFINAMNVTFNVAELAAAAMANTDVPNDSSESQTTMASKDDTAESGTTTASNSDQSDDDSNEAMTNILELKIPQQLPPILNVDVKPILITDTNPWSSMRILWLILAFVLVGVTASAFMFVIMRRSRKHRAQKQNQFQATTMVPPIYTTASPTSATPEVKIPIS